VPEDGTSRVAEPPLVAKGGVPAAVPAAPRGGVRTSLRAFRHRDFAIFWSGALAANTGAWLTNLAVPFVLFEITGSAFWVGLVSLAQFVPGILLSPLGGALADRYDRRRLLLLTQSGMAVSALLLWATWISGVREPAAILALVGLGGVFAGINMPSWQSFVNDLVPRDDLMSAVTLNSLQFNAARSIGPAIAGVLLAAFGPGWAFLLNGVSFVFVLAALGVVRARPRRQAAKAPGGVTRQFVAAVRYTRSQPGIRMAILVSVLVGVLGNPIFQFTVVFAGSVFHVGPVALGVLNAALGLGAVLAAPLVSGWNHRLSLGTVVRWSLVLYSLAIIGFGLAPGFVAGVVALVVVGGSFLAANSASNTAIQLIVAEPMRGRVLALRIVLFTASFPVGAVGQGYLSDLIGPRVTVVGAGVAMLLCAAALALWRGQGGLRRLDDPHDAAPVTS
jgi:MFS family permease